MNVIQVAVAEGQNSITVLSDAFLLNPQEEATVACVLTAGTPATGAVVQVTLDDEAAIAADTANWLDSPLGTHVSDTMEHIAAPVSAVRLKVTDGTWTFQVMQK